MLRTILLKQLNLYENTTAIFCIVSRPTKCGTVLSSVLHIARLNVQSAKFNADFVKAYIYIYAQTDAIQNKLVLLEYLRCRSGDVESRSAAIWRGQYFASWIFFLYCEYISSFL